MNLNQRELSLSEVSNRETIATIEANNDMYCLRKLIFRFFTYENVIICLLYFWPICINFRFMIHISEVRSFLWYERPMNSYYDDTNWQEKKT